MVVICIGFLLDVACQKLLKSATVSWSHSKNKSGLVFWGRVVYLSVWR